MSPGFFQWEPRERSRPFLVMKLCCKASKPSLSNRPRVASAHPKQQVSALIRMMNYWVWLCSTEGPLPSWHCKGYPQPHCPQPSPLVAPEFSLRGHMWHTASLPLTVRLITAVGLNHPVSDGSHLANRMTLGWDTSYNNREKGIKTNSETNFLLPGQISSLDRGWYKDGIERKADLGVPSDLEFLGFNHLQYLLILWLSVNSPFSLWQVD